MNLIEEHYYTINKSFLKILGVWPHDKSRLVLFQRILIIFLTTTHLGLQLSAFTTEKYNMALFIRIMSLVCPFVIITMKYCAFIFKSKDIKNLHQLITEDWKIILDKLESEIIQKYAHAGQFYTILLFLYICFVIILLLVIQFLPIILDVILPLDEPRPRKLIVLIEYFVFHDKYFYTKVLHEFMFFTICASMMFATGTQLLVFVCHSFGMFKLASHRVRHSVEDSVLHIPHPKKEHAICKKIMYAVIAHRRAMEFSNIFVSTFNVPYCIIAIIGVLSLSINLFGLVEAATVSKNMDNAAICLISILGHLLYIFCANYVGQKISDCNNELFRIIYGTSWYLMPVRSQKLILFLMRKAGKDFYFIIGFIFVAKIETCATLINAALSYVAVMYSCAH